MCARYVNGPMTRDYWVQLRAFLDALGMRYNVAPTSIVPILRFGDAAREPAAVRWGLIPSWSKDNKIAYRTINARSETVHEKPSFRAAFKRRRCIVLADGYYEWTGPKSDRQPHYIRLADDRPLVFFGLWESWPGPKDDPLDEPLQTCTINTTEFAYTDHLRSLLKPSDEEFVTNKVSKYVNKVGNEGPECIERLPGKQ